MTVKFTERREGSYKALVDAVKALRAHFADSQQAFGTRFGLSVRSVANYEKDRKPEARVLAAFAKAASDEGLADLKYEFMAALGADLGLSDVKGGVITDDTVKPRGYMLVQFKNPSEASLYARAFFHTFAALESTDRERRLLAHNILGEFAGAWMQNWKGLMNELRSDAELAEFQKLLETRKHTR